jgi:hypothetical protein
MKTLTRVLIVGLIVCVIYFSTIGTRDFYRLLDTLYDVFTAIGNNYLKK